MPLVFFAFSRVLRRAWRLDLAVKSPSPPLSSRPLHGSVTFVPFCSMGRSAPLVLAGFLRLRSPTRVP
eukprot:247799-Prorocentrum_minimum.AAC.4